MHKSILFFICNLLVFCSFAQISQAPNPSWIRNTLKSPVTPDLDDISEGYYYELIEYQIDLKSKTRFYKNIKVIFDNNGIENAGEVLVSFNPEYQKLIIHELKIVRDGQTIDKLKLKNFKIISSETEMHRSLYNGTKSAYFVLDDLREGDKIVFSYSLQGFNTVFDNKFFDSFNLQGYEPIGLVHVNFSVPEHRNITFKNYNNANKPTKELHEGYTNYYWESSNTPKAEYNSYSPIWYSDLDWIECSEHKNWNEVSEWVKGINPIAAIKPNSPLGKYVDKIYVEAKGDKYVFLKSATDFVQNDIRYLGIEVGEYSHRANLPEKVFTQRYGDCKDKSVLLVSILKSKGIDANIVLTNSYEYNDLKDRLPSPLHFNHMIVSVSIDGREQFIDPTITNQGGVIRDRYIPYYGNVLNIRDPKAISSLPKEVNTNLSIAEVYELKGKSEALLKVKTVYSGGNADNIRQYYKDNAKNAIQKSLLDYYAKLYPKIKKKEPLRFEDDLENNVFTVFENYLISDIGVLDPSNNRKTLGVYANFIGENLPEVLATHKAPIAINFPFNLEYDIIIVDPNSHKFTNLSERINVDRPAYYFNKGITIKQDSLKISYRLGFHDSFIAATDVETYKEDFAQRDMIFYNGFYLDGLGQLDIGLVDISFAKLPLLLFFLTIVMAILFIIRYTKSKVYVDPVDYSMAYSSIGGWLIFLAIACLLTTFNMGRELLGSEGILRANIWNITSYGLDINPVFYYIIIGLELVVNTLTIVFLFYSLYLMMKRRDIFPQTLFYILLVFALFALLDTLLVWIFIPTLFTEDLVTAVVRNLIFATIWCLYLKQSERVKLTFIIPYDGDIAYNVVEEEIVADDEDEE